MGGVIFYKSKFLVSCARTCQDPVEHTGNSTVTTCADGTTEHTEDEGLGVNICCSSASALCQTGNNDGSDFEEQQENSRKQGEEEDGILEYDSSSDDDDIPPLEREADFYLGRGFYFERSIRFNSRIVFS